MCLSFAGGNGGEERRGREREDVQYLGTFYAKDIDFRAHLYNET
jgi:hypothetical protein